jgi:hypothetical protein
MIDIVLGLFILLCFWIAAWAFFMNSQTPQPVGPIPFFTGVVGFIVCAIALIARLAIGV